MHFIISTITFCLFSIFLFADTNIYLPQTLLEDKEHSLLVINNGDQDSWIELWAYVQKSQAVLSYKYDIKAQQKEIINLEKWFAKEDLIWLKRGILNPQDLSFYLTNSKQELSLEHSPGHYWEHSIHSKAEIYIQNLSSQENESSITCGTDKSQNFEIKLKAYQHYKFLLSECTKLNIKTQYRSLSWKKDSENLVSIAKAYSQNEIKTSLGEAYFLVAPTDADNEDKNFVIHLNDAKQIALARQAIAEPNNPDLPRLVNGKIAFGHRNYNLNPHNPQKAFWSWHLEEVQISHMGAIWCNTNPQLLEDLLYSVDKKKDRACPWNYQVLKELKANLPR